MKKRIVAVANEKGGVGKTATVVNLAAALSQKGKKVLVVDMDPQHSATIGLGIEPTEDMTTVYDLLMTPAKENVANAVIETGWKGLDLLPSHPDLAGAEIELIHEEGRENRLSRAMNEIENTYDIVLIDTPPSLSLLSVNALACANEVLVPCQTNPYAYLALEDLFDTIATIKEEINPNLDITGILLTFYDKRTTISRNVFDRIRSDPRYKDLLYSSVIRANTTIAESVEVSRPVVFYRKGCNGSADYQAFAEEFLLPVFL